MNRTTWHRTLFTPLPASTPPDQITSLLQDHPSLIRLSPLVTCCELRDSPSFASSSQERRTYDIQERIPFILGLGTTIAFTATFTNVPNGIETILHAPLRLVSKQKCRVLRTEEARRDASHVTDGEGTEVRDAEGNGVSTEWVFREDIESEVAWALKWYVDSTLVKTRREIASRMIEKVKQRN